MMHRHSLTVAFILVSGLSLFAATNPPMVIDANGQVIGDAFSTNQVLIQVDRNTQVLTPVYLGGFLTGPPVGFLYYHTTSDCSGARYLVAQTLPKSGYLINQVLYFPDTITLVTFHSAEYYDQSMNRLGPGWCYAGTYTSYAGPVRAIDLGAFGFVPPFSVR